MVSRIIRDINDRAIMVISKTEINETDKASFIDCVKAYNIDESIYQRLVSGIDGSLTKLKETSPRDYEVNSNVIWICQFLQILSTDSGLRDTTIQKHTSGIGITDKEYIGSTIYKFINQLGGLERILNRMYHHTDRVMLTDFSDYAENTPNERYTENLQDELLIAQHESDLKTHFELRGDDTY